VHSNGNKGHLSTSKNERDREMGNKIVLATARARDGRERERQGEREGGREGGREGRNRKSHILWSGAVTHHIGKEV